MFKVKSFVKEESLSVNIMPNGDTDMMTKEPSVLISAKDLYRMIHGKGQALSSKIDEFVKRLYNVHSLPSYNKELENELARIAVDVYCSNELEDDAFMTGDKYKDLVSAE